MNAHLITEAENIRRTRFLLESKNQHDLMVRQILSEGAEYALYLQLNEAPIGDVVNKIKTSIAKMPKAMASKVIQAVRSLPKAALPLAATIVMSMAAQGVNAQQSDMQSQLNKLDSLLTQFNQDTAVLGQTTKNGTALPTAAKPSAASSAVDLDAQAAQIEKDYADKNAKLAAAGQSAVDDDYIARTGFPKQQIMDARKILGGGSPELIGSLLKNKADLAKLRKLLDKYGVPSGSDTDVALSVMEPLAANDLGQAKIALVKYLTSDANRFYKH